MEDQRLRKLLGEMRAPAVRIEAQEKAVNEARCAWEEERRTANRTADIPSTRSWFPLVAAGTAAGLAAISLLALHLFRGQPASPGEFARSDSSDAVLEMEHDYNREKSLLHELEQLFEGRLQFIVLNNGESRIEVSEYPVFGAQPVVVELRQGDDVLRVLSYSGNVIELEIGGKPLVFEVLVDGDGDVLMAGRDFIWSSRSTEKHENFSVRAAVITG